MEVKRRDFFYEESRLSVALWLLVYSKVIRFFRAVTSITFI
jgi:hypothetical protein